MNHQLDFQHFILTRFNILLWRQDKEGCPVRTVKWLKHRFLLFENYCLPSIAAQTCKNFEWIVLFDSKTPDFYKNKIADYQLKCPQLIPVYVDPRQGRYFAQIFRTEVVKRLKASRVITSYLDNDDALNIKYVEDLQQRALSVCDETFINYTDGCQFFTDYKYLLQIHYPRNHFISVVERGIPSTVKTIFGYGSHYYIDKIPGVKIEKVKSLPMWCEVIHEKNMSNDAYFILRTRMIRDCDMLRRDYAIEEMVTSGIGLYVFRFIPRYIKTFIRRIKYYLFGRHW